MSTCNIMFKFTCKLREIPLDRTTNSQNKVIYSGLHELNSNLINNINFDGKKISNSHNNQIIVETHIKTFIQNLNLIYNRISLTNYSKKYLTEFDTFNTTLLLNLTTYWNINIKSNKLSSK